MNIKLQTRSRLLRGAAMMGLLWLGSGSGAYCADIVVRYPKGWSASQSPEGFSIVDDKLAIVLSQGEWPQMTTRIMLVHDIFSQPVETIIESIPGVATAVQLSPDGSLLLVHSNSAGLPDGFFKVTMVDSDGLVLWSKDENRFFRFSAGGVLYSTEQGRYFGRTIRLHAPTGATLRDISLATSPVGSTGPTATEELRGAVPLGDGSSVVFATERRVRRIDLTPSPHTAWIVSAAHAIAGLREFDSGRVLAEQHGGGFQIIRVADGFVEYVLNPDELIASGNFPGTTRVSWSGYRACPGDDANTVVVFDRTEEKGYVVDLSNGTLAARSVDASASPGSVVAERVHKGRAVIFGPTHVRIRPVLSAGR